MRCTIKWYPLMRTLRTIHNPIPYQNNGESWTVFYSIIPSAVPSGTHYISDVTLTYLYLSLYHTSHTIVCCIISVSNCTDLSIFLLIFCWKFLKCISMGKCHIFQEINYHKNTDNEGDYTDSKMCSLEPLYCMYKIHYQFYSP